MSFETAFTIVMTLFIIAAPAAMVLIIVTSARLPATLNTAANTPEPEAHPDYAEAPFAA